MKNNHKKYLLGRISKFRNEMKADPSKKENNEYLVGELNFALSKYTFYSKTNKLDDYSNYLLDIIEEYEEDSKKEPEEKEVNDLVIAELEQALSNYNYNMAAV